MPQEYANAYTPVRRAEHVCRVLIGAVSNSILETVPIRSRMIEAGLWDASDQRDPGQSIEAAFQVVEHMCRMDPPWFFSFDARTATTWEVTFDNGRYDDDGQATGFGFDISESAPLAICRAALAALGVEVRT